MFAANIQLQRINRIFGVHKVGGRGDRDSEYEWLRDDLADRAAATFSSLKPC